MAAQPLEPLMISIDTDCSSANHRSLNFDHGWQIPSSSDSSVASNFEEVDFREIQFISVSSH